MSAILSRRKALALMASASTAYTDSLWARAPRPVLVFLQGAVDEAQSAAQSDAWSGDFTVIRGEPRDPLEAHDVLLQACKRLRTRQAILVGHGQGAAIGLHVARRWPHLVSTFVSTGQPTGDNPLRVTRDLDVPLLIVRGRDDRVSPGEASRYWFRHVRAPRKGYSTIDGDHFACFTHPMQFMGAVRGFVQ